MDDESGRGTGGACASRCPLKLTDTLRRPLLQPSSLLLLLLLLLLLEQEHRTVSCRVTRGEMTSRL